MTAPDALSEVSSPQLDTQLTGRCSCNQLAITFRKKPVFVAACHCENCQVRTGSAFGINAYFADKHIVKQKGVSHTYTETGNSGRSVTRHFCPSCGTTVFWKADFLPGFTGTAGGCFAGQALPAPTISAWSCRKKPWVTLPKNLLYMQTQELNECELQQFAAQKARHAKPQQHQPPL